MKLILLASTFILFGYRIKYTPTALSRKLWRKDREKLLEKNKNVLDGKTKDDKYTYIGCAASLSWFIYLLCIVYYIMIGCRFPNTPLFWMSAIQLVTIAMAWKNSFKEMATLLEEPNDKDFKFWYRAFNVVFDYMYYPMAIYMLVQ